MGKSQDEQVDEFDKFIKYLFLLIVNKNLLFESLYVYHSLSSVILIPYLQLCHNFPNSLSKFLIRDMEESDIIFWKFCETVL